ncbi:DUF397 domain-containing protein [Micromonospora echinaurantiaca]|uniref:DUF397 domain-containing protein n=1 Tax=Micromonospora echinaurantiaca TaxID=47857 RepID=UPI00379461AD
MITSEWSKSSFSGPNCDNCVECRINGDMIEVRDSKDPSGPVQRYRKVEWVAFLAAAKGGRFDAR